MAKRARRRREAPRRGAPARRAARAAAVEPRAAGRGAARRAHRAPRRRAPVDPALWNTAVPVDPGTYTIVAEAPALQAVADDGADRRADPAARGRPCRRSSAAPAAPAPTSSPGGPAAHTAARSRSPSPSPRRARRTWSTTRGLAAALAAAGAGSLGTGAYFGWRARDLDGRSDRRCPFVECDDAEALRAQRPRAHRRAAREHPLRRRRRRGRDRRDPVVRRQARRHGDPPRHRGRRRRLARGELLVRAGWLIAAAAAGAGACSVEKKVPFADAGGDAPPLDAPPDDRPPETTITSAPGPFSRQGAAVFGFASDDPAATFECSIDGEPRVCRACRRTRARSATGRMRSRCARSTRPATAIRRRPSTCGRSTRSRPTRRSSSRRRRRQQRDGALRVPVERAERRVRVLARWRRLSGVHERGPVRPGRRWPALVRGARARPRPGNVDTSPAIHAWVVDTSTPDTHAAVGPERLDGEHLRDVHVRVARCRRGRDVPVLARRRVVRRVHLAARAVRPRRRARTRSRCACAMRSATSIRRRRSVRGPWTSRRRARRS